MSPPVHHENMPYVSIGHCLYRRADEQAALQGAEEAVRVLERLPMVAVNWKPPMLASGQAELVADADADADALGIETWVLEVELRRQRGGRAAARVHAPRFPKARSSQQLTLSTSVSGMLQCKNCLALVSTYQWHASTSGR